MSSHENYCTKKGFSFPILSDPDGKTVAKYKTTKIGGFGVQRSVYAFDPDGKIIFAEQGMADYNDILAVIKES